MQKVPEFKITTKIFNYHHKCKTYVYFFISVYVLGSMWQRQTFTAAWIYLRFYIEFTKSLAKIGGCIWVILSRNFYGGVSSWKTSGGSTQPVGANLWWQTYGCQNLTTPTIVDNAVSMKKGKNRVAFIQ